MTSPTFKKVTNTTTDPSNVRYGAPDLVYVMDVLDGTHATDRIQASNIEGVATLTGAETLTNKTIFHNDNTLPDVVSTNTAQSITGVKTYDNSTLKIKDMASGFAYTLIADEITGDVSLYLPNVLSGNHTIVARTTTETLTNKTIAFGDNTLTDVASTNTSQTLSNKTIAAVGTPSITATGAVALDSTSRIYLDGVAATGNSYIQESAADTIQVVSGGTVKYEARSAHALTKGFEGTADPTTTDIPAGYFTVGERTDTGDVKLWYNDGGTLKFVALGTV